MQALPPWFIWLPRQWISTGTAVYAAVGNVKLATAMAAAEQSCKQRLAASDRTFAHEALPVGVVGDQSLIPLERAPGNVTLMVIVDQNLPITAAPPEAAHDLLAAGVDGHATGRASESVGASVNGVREDVVDRVVDRQLPFDPTTLRPVHDGR